LDEARAELGIVQRNLSRAVIKSPADGVVLQRHQTRRQFLQAGTPLLTIGNLDDMEVIAEVLTERAPAIRAGAAVELFGRALEAGPLRGHVLRVYPAGFKKISSLGVEQQRVKVAIKLDQRPPRLGVGFRVHVRIIYDQADNTLILPRTCIYRSPQGQWQVLAVRGGRTELQAVGVGILNDDQAQITSGLSNEDQVVLHPSKDIVPGMRVRPIDDLH
jgi:HlyD family secretion protein